MDSKKLMHSIIQAIATGPNMSKDIDFTQAKLAMTAILNGEIEDIQVAIFLIALRMKRETNQENQGILAAILDKSDKRQINVDNLVDLGEPYSGYSRSIPTSSFLPPLLAELGIPVIIHGLDNLTPKFGLTHRHINKALGLNVDCSVTKAKERLEDKSIGWTYLDQAQYCKPLYSMLSLRNSIVKRTVINTIETLICPIRAKKTHSIKGYVHKAYQSIYVDLVKANNIDTTLLVKGIEGGVTPSLRQPSTIISHQENHKQQNININPLSLNINRNVRAISLPKKFRIENNISAIADYTAKLGKLALSGESGEFYDSLVLSASLILWHLKKVKSIEDGAEQVRFVLNSGKAIKRLQ
jgi:anthranilate phosphoribosyltransferase